MCIHWEGVVTHFFRSLSAFVLRMVCVLVFAVKYAAICGGESATAFGARVILRDGQYLSLHLS